MGEQHLACQIWLRTNGRAYPRTCATCGLRGPCLYYTEVQKAPPAPDPLATARQEGIKEGMERAAKMIEASPKDTSLLALAAALRALIIMEARDHLEQQP